MTDRNETIRKVEEICHARQNRADALIEILHDVQEVLGHIPELVMPAIARELNLSRAEVFGVVSFYQDFRTAPVNGPVVKLCRAEACQSMGCDALEAALEKHAGWPGERPEIRTVYCLGNCALAPAAMVGSRLIGRADAGKIADAVMEARECSEQGQHDA